MEEILLQYLRFQEYCRNTVDQTSVWGGMGQELFCCCFRRAFKKEHNTCRMRNACGRFAASILHIRHPVDNPLIHSDLKQTLQLIYTTKKLRCVGVWDMASILSQAWACEEIALCYSSRNLPSCCKENTCVLSPEWNHPRDSWVESQLDNGLQLDWWEGSEKPHLPSRIFKEEWDLIGWKPGRL